MPLAPVTLARLEQLSEDLAKRGVQATPLQVAAMLLERALREMDDLSTAELARRDAS